MSLWLYFRCLCFTFRVLYDDLGTPQEAPSELAPQLAGPRPADGRPRADDPAHHVFSWSVQEVFPAARIPVPAGVGGWGWLG